MAITIPRTPMTDDDGSGTTGTILNNAWKTALYNQIDAALALVPAEVSGAFTPIAFNAANYTSNAGTWSVDAGDQVTLGYTLIGKLCCLFFDIRNTDKGTAAAEVRLALPAAISSVAVPALTSIYITNAGTAGMGIADVDVGVSYIRFRTASGSQWTVTTGDNLTVNGQLWFLIA